MIFEDPKKKKKKNIYPLPYAFQPHLSGSQNLGIGIAVTAVVLVHAGSEKVCH